MKTGFKYCFYSFATVVLILLHFSVVSQTQNDDKFLEISFFKPKGEIAISKSYFNYLEITNTKAATKSFTVNFTVPVGWNFIGSTEKNYSLKSGETIKIPFRVSCPPTERGGISFVVGASIALRNGKTVQSEFCYVNLIAESKIKAKFQKRIEYFDPDFNKAEIGIQLKNEGNTTEIVYLELETSSNLTIIGEENHKLITPIVLGIQTDTLVKFDVYQIKNNEAFMNYWVVNAKIRTPDTTYRSNVWFREIKSFFRNNASYISPLVVDLNFNNLLGGSKTRVHAVAFGTVLLKKQRDIYYNLNIYPRIENPILNSRILVGFRTPTLHIMAGDIACIGVPTYGKGIRGSYRLGKHIIDAATSYNPITKNFGAGAGYSGLINIISLRAEAGYGVDNRYNAQTITSNINIGTQLFKNNSISASISGSNTHLNDYNVDRFGLLGALAYQGTWDKLQYSASGSYSSKNYIGKKMPDVYATANVLYTFNPNMEGILSYNYSKNFSSPYFYLDYLDVTSMQNYFSTMEQLDLTYRYKLRPKIHFFLGNSLDRQASNHFYLSEYGEFFQVSSSYAFIGGRILDTRYNNSLSFKFKYGYSTVDNFYTSPNGISNPEIKEIPAYSNAHFTSSLRRRAWGISLGYHYGPYSLYHHYSYFYSRTFNSSISISPYYDKAFFDNKLLISARVSYFALTKGISEKFSGNLNIQWFLKKGWTVRAYANYFSSTQKDNLKEDIRENRGLYIGMSIRKEFGIQQPRIRYYDVNIVFFSDYNGDDIKADDEPGVKYVLTTIKKDTSLSGSEPISFSQIELLTDQDGTIYMERVPEGNYSVSYMPLNDQTYKYNAESNTITITVDEKKTIYIPFKENYKVMGKVILNRDKFSNLGHISPQNIKITATDEDDKNFSTLTNYDGSYLLSIPNKSGSYKVSVNNIFGENFELVQNDYIIEINGMKEFRLDFIFNEKNRTINFNNNGGNNNPGNIKTFGSVDTEVDTAAAMDYIDRLFDGIEEEVEDPVNPTYSSPPDNTPPDNSGTPDNSSSIDFNSSGGDNYNGATDETETSTTDTPVETASDSPEPTATETETPVETAAEETPAVDESSEETIAEETPVVEDSPVGEETAVETTSETTETEAPDSDEPAVDIPPGANDVIIKDDDPNYLPISKIVGTGTNFRVRMYKFGLPRFSAYTFGGIEGVICVDNPGGDYLYYGKAVSDYKEAKTLLKQAVKEDFDQAEIVGFKDGKPVSIEEAGAFSP